MDNRHPALLSSQLLFEGFFKLRRDTYQNSLGHRYDYYSLETRAPAAVVLPVSDNGDIIVCRELRHSVGMELLSLPGGYIDADESPTQAAERELREETGYAATAITVMGSAYPYPGISSQLIYYLLAEGCQQTAAPATEATEYITLDPMPLAALQRLIVDGTPVDGNLCTALFHFQNRR